MNERWRHSTRSRGQAIVELAIVTPLLLLLVMGAVDVGRLLFISVAVEEAAQEGALYAAMKSSATTSEISSRVTSSSNHAEVTGATVTVSCADSPAPGTITVKAEVTVALLTPIVATILGDAVAVAASVTATNFQGTACPVPA